VAHREAKQPAANAMVMNGLAATANGLTTEKPFLPRVIEFVKARGSQDANTKTRNEDDEPQEPQYFLYPPERLHKLFGETSPRRVGRGLQNLGNTCYFNSVLQVLTYAPPLQNYLLTKEHSAGYAKRDGTVCTLSLFEEHVHSVFEAQRAAFRPLGLLRHLPQIAKRFQSKGRQEDAHEFLIHFLDSCHKSFLKHAATETSTPRPVQQTTVIGQLFGGHLRSQVLCKRCKHPSNTFDPYMDISLEVQNANTLEKALEGFTHSEILSGANKYMCKKCAQKVDASKRFSIHNAPPLLTFQLKRFDFFHGLRGKLKKLVKFPTSLDIARFTSHPEREARYRLYGVVVHCGHSAKSGHYIAFAKHNGTWHCFNDESVRAVGEPEVLKQEAYLLFYVSDMVQKVAKASAVVTSKETVQQVVNGIKANHLPSVAAHTNGKVNGVVKHNGTHVEELHLKKSPPPEESAGGTAKKLVEAGENAPKESARNLGNRSRLCRLKRLRQFQACLSLRAERRPLADGPNPGDAPPPPSKRAKVVQQDAAERVAASMDYSTQYGQAEVERWDDQTLTEEQHKAFQAVQEKLQPLPKRRDELDMEYDVGKKKHKAKKSKVAFEGRSAFDLEEQRRRAAKKGAGRGDGQGKGKGKGKGRGKSKGKGKGKKGSGKGKGKFR